MRTLQVRLAAGGFTLALGLAVAASAWVASRTVARGHASAPATPGGATLDPAAGAELFERHCAACHAPEELAPALAVEDPAGAVLALLDFLDEHGAADPREDRAIAAFLRESAR